MMHHQKGEMSSFACSDAGMECDFHVCGSNQQEVLSAAQDHARRAHGKEMSSDQLKQYVKSGEMASCPG